MRCEGSVALVTGAARRVGRAIAIALSEAGCGVAVHYRESAEDARQLVAQLQSAGRRAIAVRGDLADPASPAAIVAEVTQKLGGLDVLVNNAAIFEEDPPDGFAFAHWQRTMQINTLAPAALISAAADSLARSGAGKVINLTDISAERPRKRHVVYCASKAALVSVTRSFARSLAPAVQVNAVAPGIAIFPEAYQEELKRKLIAKVPGQRAGTPEEIGQTVRFLVEHGDYITGQVINVDGGRSIV